MWLGVVFVEAHAPEHDAVVTIFEPFDGHVLRETNSVQISYTVEAVQPWRGADHPPEAVVGLTDEGGAYFPVHREPVDALIQDVGPITHESSVTIQGVPNGQYTLSVQIEGGGGGEAGGEAEGRLPRKLPSAATTFSVDVAVELTRVDEEEDDDDVQDGSEANVDPETEAAEGEQGGDEMTAPALSSFTDEDFGAMERCKDLGLLPRRRPARIFDGFTYKDEIDLLEVFAYCLCVYAYCLCVCVHRAHVLMCWCCLHVHVCCLQHACVRVHACMQDNVVSTRVHTHTHTHEHT